MTNVAILALDIQNGFITPQNQELVFNALRVAESAATHNTPLITSSIVMNVPPEDIMDMFIWHSWQSHEAARLFDPMETIVAAANPSLHCERQMPSAWTTASNLFAKQHSINEVAILGIDNEQSLMMTVIDLLDKNFTVYLLEDVLDANLDSLPANIKKDVKIVSSESFMGRSK